MPGAGDQCGGVLEADEVDRIITIIIDIQIS
jgi:hypothetical protein